MEEITNKLCSAEFGANHENKQDYVKPKRILVDECIIIKEPNCDIVKNKTTITVSNKSNFKALLGKCEKLLDNGAEELCIHGLGAAVNKTCNLALQLQENHKGTLELDITTSTVRLYDNLIPETDDGLAQVRERLNSAIRIRVYRKIPFQSLRFKKQQTSVKP